MCLVRGEVKTDNAKFEIVMNIANTDHSQGYLVRTLPIK